MHLSPMELSEIAWLGFEDKDRLKREWKNCIETLNKRKKNWEKSCKNSEKTYDFLKHYIYEKKNDETEKNSERS